MYFVYLIPILTDFRMIYSPFLPSKNAAVIDFIIFLLLFLFHYGLAFNKSTSYEILQNSKHVFNFLSQILFFRFLNFYYFCWFCFLKIRSKNIMLDTVCTFSWILLVYSENISTKKLLGFENKLWWFLQQFHY